MNREAWLTECLTKLRSDFERVGFPLPEGIRVTCGWPSKSALAVKRKRIGECWSPTCSKDGHHEVFISPAVSDPMEVLATLVHELDHAAVGVEAKHKGPFKACALALGLEGKMTATVAGEALKVRLQEIIEDVGEYEHAGLDKLCNGMPKQTCRQLKLACADCGCIVRMSQKMIDSPGPPTCACGGQMVPESTIEKGKDE